jgi:hypothetical protein
VATAGAWGIQSVVLYPRTGSNVNGGLLDGVAVKVNAAGEFEARLAPGSYTAEVSAMRAPGSRTSGRAIPVPETLDDLVSNEASLREAMASFHTWNTPVEVDRGDIQGLVLTVGDSPLFEISGRVRVDGQPELRLRGPGVAILRGGPTTSLDSPLVWTSPIAEDGTFTGGSVGTGRYGLWIVGLPGGFYLKSIRSGGAEVLYSGIDFSSGPADVEVIVSPGAGSVAGSVMNADSSRPAPGATVVLVPQGKERVPIPALYRQATTDQNGYFRFKNVAPGEYRVYAWDRVESGAWLDPDFMMPLSTKGVSVKMTEGAPVGDVDVSLIVADSE